MAVPSFVGAGAGAVATTGTGTVSKTGCTAGNLLVAQLVIRGNNEDWSALTNAVNVRGLTGTLNSWTLIQQGLGIGSFADLAAVFCARVAADGTCSGDFTVGASGEDLFARIYEFTDASVGTTVDTVFENGSQAGGGYFSTSATNTSIEDTAVTTNGPSRLALQFVATASNQTLGDFTGETGGDWSEAVDQFNSATGATATLQLQTAVMAAAGVINGGAIATASVAWGTYGLALRPGPAEEDLVARGGRGSSRVYR